MNNINTTLNFSDLIKEAIEPDEVDVTSIRMNDTLNPLIWESEDKIKPEIRKALLLNAKRFIEFSGIEKLTFKDIVLTGSLANYNYNENSDLDVHTLLDFNQISENKNFVDDYLKLKKDLWTKNMSIQIKGFDVETYFQDIAEKHMSTGVYSLMNDSWVRKPLKQIINIDTINIKAKSSDLMNSIDGLIKNITSSSFLNKYKFLKDKIKKLRQSGLELGGEFSTENLVFKILRNTGYLRKMVDAKKEYLKNELSLSETKT